MSDMSVSSGVSSLDEDLRQAFKLSDDPVLTAVEVGEMLGVSQQAAHAKLTKAAEKGEVERKKVGARAVVWWLKSQESADAKA